MKTIAMIIGLFTLGAIAGCHEGDEGLNNGVTDMTMKVTHDLSMPDMTGKTCGAIVLCAIQNGTTNPLGALQCFTGASQEGQTEATALIACAAQNCLGGDGGIGGALGGGNQLGILQCLSSSCQMQLSACSGLSI